MPINPPNIPCYHCGLDCHTSEIAVEEKIFCCHGCMTVYEILKASDLCDYYDLNQSPGSTPNEMGLETKYGFLGDESLQKQLLNFADGDKANITLTTPTMHCSSCIWLLESLYKLNDGITYSKVNFLKKTLNITYNTNRTNLQSIVQLLASLGYEPEFNLQQISNKTQQTAQKSLYIKIGIAGFAFANIMLLSLPEYFAKADEVPESFIWFFGWLNILLALPVLLFSARDYFISAWKGIIHRVVNMDIPIALGISTLFIRSAFEIVSEIGQGWMDSFSGLVFFLLIGRLFQDKTYQRLSFDRDYKSYFPLSVIRKRELKEESIPLGNLNPGDRILVRNNEIIPADSILISGHGNVDYSFVTGESDAVKKQSGDMIYAGGKQVGSTVELEVVKVVSQSYLTQLWNNDVFRKEDDNSIDSLANTVAKYFTAIVISIAVATLLYWLPNGIQSALNAATAVLIVACPCALALTIPFTFGTAMRFFGRIDFYIKNSQVIERLAEINTIVFDKTGTMTDSQGMEIEFIPEEGDRLSENEIQLIRDIARHSTHPLSRKLVSFLPITDLYMEPESYEEIPGKGIIALIDGKSVMLGSSVFVTGEKKDRHTINATRVFLTIDDINRGYFEFRSIYRKGLRVLMSSLVDKYEVDLLSGDNDHEKENLLPYFGGNSVLKFNQSPEDKMKHIHSLQKRGDTVMMVGDGMNDAGALKQSNIGISISEDVHAFSPACDAILNADEFQRLPNILRMAKSSRSIVKVGFAISFLYNIVGLTLAVQGYLSPLVSAILMPISSVTVVVFSTVATSLAANRILTDKDI